jgi:hypothetical protein
MKCPDCGEQGSNVHLPFWEKWLDGKPALCTIWFCENQHIWYTLTRRDVTGTFKIIAVESVKELVSL